MARFVENLQAASPSIDAALIGAVVTSATRTFDLQMKGLATVQAALLGELGPALAAAGELIRNCQGTVVVSGMGKSGHIARKIAATLSSTGTPSYFLHPAEASHGDLGLVSDDDVVLAVSWSGETTELLDVINYSRRFSLPLIAITSRPDSALGTAADVGLFLPPSPEACPNGLAPTTSTTMQLVLGDALAIWLLERRGFSASDFQRFHPGGKLGAKLAKAKSLMHEGASLPLVASTAMLSAAIIEITSKRFGVTGVVDDSGELVGVITDGDLRRAFSQGFVDKPVADAMGRSPHIVEPDRLAADVLGQMNAARITSVFVVQNKKPLGLIHIHDLLKAGVL